MSEVCVSEDSDWPADAADFWDTFLHLAVVARSNLRTFPVISSALTLTFARNVDVMLMLSHNSCYGMLSFSLHQNPKMLFSHTFHLEIHYITEWVMKAMLTLK